MRIALVAAILASTLGQAGGQPFVGQWAAEQNGRPVVRLELRVTNGALGGSIQLADIHVDGNGNVETVLSDLSPASALVDVVAQTKTVVFARRDGNDIDQFEMTLTDDASAELRFVPTAAVLRELADDGIPMPRPIRLTRTKP